MGSLRILLFALSLHGLLTHGAKLGGGSCKNCKNKNAPTNSQRLIASPINLLNPDRYEFFTLDDKGKVVKRIMTFKEIQSIVAGSDITELKLFANKHNNDRIVSSVVSNVRNVLNNELNLLNGHDPIEQAVLPISDVINVPPEPSATATMYDVLNKLGESLVTATAKRTTTTQATEITEQTTASTTTTVPVATSTLVPNASTERLTTRLKLKTTAKPTTVTEAALLKERTTASTTTTTSTTVKPTQVSATERTTVRSTMQPVETTPKLRSSTVRPTESSTTEQPTVAKTTQQPSTTFAEMTRKPTISSTGRPTESIKHSTEGRHSTTTTEAPMLLKWAETSLAAAVRLTTQAPTLKPSHPSTTSPPPTEPPMAKEATAMVRSTEAPTSRTSEVELPIVKTTVASFAKQTAAPPLELPLVPVSTVKPSTEQSVEHSSQRSEEVSEGDNYVEYSTEQSSEKWSDDHSGSGESFTASEETSTGGATLTALDEAGPTVKTVEPVTMDVPEVSNTLSPAIGGKIGATQQLSTEQVENDQTEELDAFKDSEASADESGSTEQLFQTTGGLSTWFMDPVTQLITTPQRTQDSGVDDHLETTFATGGKLDAEIATTTSFEVDSSTAQDSTGYSDEQSEELELTTLNRYSEESTTTANAESYLLQTEAEQTMAQDTSTIPTDAQHAIHKIIESLQSINDNSGSEESEETDLQETGYPGDVPGMHYDTDAQSSINAIIQSLGQGTLGGGGGEAAFFPLTTDTITTPAVEHTTSVETIAAKINTPTMVIEKETRPPVPSSVPTTTTTTSTTASTTTTMTLPVLKTSKPAVMTSEEADTASNFNYNTNIMDTIEKFLSTFASLPKESSYAANLTELNILSDYPAEINMTDYVDRTATVASVLKFPPRGASEVLDVTSESESLEEITPTESVLMLADQQPILSETVASFMKLGEMLTMDAKVSSTEIPIPVQLEVKAALDEEETELLRFLSICSNLGTNVYGSLTDASNARSMSDQSLVYSPFATITTLSMLFLGTRGATAENINGVIGLDEMTSFNPHLFFKSVAEDLTPKNRRASVLAHERNAVHPDSTFQRTLLSDESRGGLQRFFKARIQEIYSTVAETVDFRQKDMLLRHMNGDFPREYVDTLKQMRSPLVSISRNRYRHECNGADTSFGVMPIDSRLTDRPSSVVPSVTFRSGFSTGYSKVLDATILALPGSTSNVSVYFLKPSTAGGITELETHLRNQSIANVLKLFPDETVRTAYAEVQLPHFTQTTIFNMTESIRQLGLQNLFEANVANFNGLQDSSTSNLYLSEILQTDSFALCAGSDTATRILPLRSFSTNLIKHDGQTIGERSDDPTSGRLMWRNRRKLAFRNRSASDDPNTPNKLVFDSPFLYLVRHNPTGMVLYMGRYVGNA
ncbi:mucin-5AC [Anopheles marshallii]|uniref:mucin-5AC n=1 Tax=Anopheles marshallii TaxID=1521116 RepID=UPI00237B97C2|nr:mucin-5AC [Anopheles marshallii]